MLLRSVTNCFRVFDINVFIVAEVETIKKKLCLSSCLDTEYLFNFDKKM